MNTRNIYNGNVHSTYYDTKIKVFGTSIRVFPSVTHFLGGITGIKFKFARRPFVGAQRLKFYLSNNDWSAFECNDEFHNVNIHLCENMARKYLSLGKRTKKFSLWVQILK